HLLYACTMGIVPTRRGDGETGRRGDTETGRRGDTETRRNGPRVSASPRPRVSVSPCLRVRLRREAFAGDRLHQLAEPIELAERGVDIGRDANPLELFVQDRRRENAMFVEEIRANRRRIDTTD